ncbi:MAG: hypothetical protein Q9160_008067 [Pyrenula sp. 1 TL-2023]
MAKKSKLLNALDAHKGRDYDAEKRKKQVKAAERRKRKRSEDEEEDLARNLDAAHSEHNPGPLVVVETNNIGRKPQDGIPQQGGDFFGFSASEDDGEATQNRSKSPSPSASLSSASSLPLSEVSNDSDIIPHHRLTINNSAALTTSTKRIRLSQSHPQTPFSKTHCLVSPLNPNVPDPNDDLTRELEFYKICASAATKARHILLHETNPPTPFSRPSDYFAEMVKPDSHMQKIREKMRREAAERKAATEARRQRDLKKFGKAVQVAKEQERAKEKRQTLEKIKDLKRKRKGNETGLVRETDEDLFDVEIDQGKSGANSGPKAKRQKRDAKFGFGGKKRFNKSGTAASTADMKGFPSAKKMKGSNAGRLGKTKRLGKSRRAKPQ